MEVTRILPHGPLNDHPLKHWQPGERLFVEVINKNGEGEGTIRVNDQVLSAILETSAQLGDKFWVQVGEVKEGFLLLLRDPQVNIQKDATALNLSQFKELTERGLPSKQNLMTLIKDFAISDTSIFDNLENIKSFELIKTFREHFPNWASLSEDNGAEKILECLRKLGINYEHRLQQMVKLDSAAKEIEKESLKSTLKFAILNEINQQSEEDGNDFKGNLANLLNKLTGQQLWYKTGILKNGFVLLHLPIMNQNQVMLIKVGIEGTRKGFKLDDRHCRVAIQLETKELGNIGIDAYFNQDSVIIKVLSNDISIPEFVEEVIPETKVQYAKLGFMLEKVETEDFEQNCEFHNFLHGIRRSGVDAEG